MNGSLIIKVIAPDLEGHELMRRFTSRTRRLLRIKPKYGHHCRMSWASATQSGHVPSARTCSTWYPRYSDKMVRIPSPANTSVMQRNRIDRGIG
ncbi:hypothetical protein PIB30_007589 [Stylosanthes scabra]|uniref:Uncharacterized protein n=1 Tax=Stylosanthes scabra TaxID=79078 RepID=A0ABU6U3P8_9FABA|nr:hypothetical protein [Stylosanthes scabra]